MEARQRLVTLAELRNAPPRRLRPATPGPPSAATRPTRNQLKVIAEIKRRSPSKGDLASIVTPPPSPCSTPTAARQ